MNLYFVTNMQVLTAPVVLVAAPDYHTARCCGGKFFMESPSKLSALLQVRDVESEMGAIPPDDARLVQWGISYPTEED